MTQENADTLNGPARRTVLKLGAAALGIGVATRTGLLGGAAPALAQSGGYEVIANAFGFTVDIAGAPTASGQIRAVEGLAVKLDPRKPKPNYKKAVHGPVRLTFAAPADEITAWWNDTKNGACTRKNITITLRKSDGSAGRQIVLHECYPTQWSSVNFDTSSTVQTEILTVKIGRIELTT